MYSTLIEEKLRTSYDTTLYEDRELLKLVQESGAKYHWMYQYVLIYRIGQKEILQRHITLCDFIAPLVEEHLDKGDIETFREKVQFIASTNNMGDYVSELLDLYKIPKKKSDLPKSEF